MKVGLRPSIAKRLWLALLLACVLVWGAIYTLGHWMVYAEESGSFDREMLALAQSLTRLTEAATDDEGRLVAMLEGVGAKIASDSEVLGYPEGFLAFIVLDSQGRLLARAGAGPQQVPDGPDGYADLAGAQAYRAYRTQSADGRYRIVVTQSTRSRRLNFDSVMISREGLLQPLLVAFPLVLLPVWLSVHSGLRPLRRLSSELAQRRPGDLAPLRVTARYAELEPLVRELNTTLARLHALLQRERSLLADAAHELRTPLAVISAQRDRWIHSSSAEERHQATQRLDLGIARAGRLVGQLLALARLDAEGPHEAASVDLADIARDSLAIQAAEAHSRGIELSYRGPDQAPCRGPQQAFESIIDNLVSNAVRYGRVGGRVELQLERQAGRMRLEVRDDGPGIAPALQDRLFERFVRGAHDGQNGSGLGLAIVRSAARRIDADIELGPGLDGRGVAFSLQWALPSDPSAPA